MPMSNKVVNLNTEVQTLNTSTDLDYVQGELLETLTKIDKELEEIERKSQTIQKFVGTVYQSKSSLLELRLSTLRQLSTLILDKRKLEDKDSIKDIDAITDLLNKKK